MAEIEEQADTGTPETPQNPRKWHPVLWIIPVIAVLNIVWVFALKFGCAPSFAMRISITDWVNGSTLVLVILIIILILLIPSGRRVELGEAEAKPKVPKRKAVTVEGVEVAVAEKGKEDEKGEGVGVEAVEVEGEAVDVGAEVAEEAEVSGEEEAAPPPKIIEYPREVEGGIYGDTYIDVGDGFILKLRTLLVDGSVFEEF
jgi:hypothetical protein